MAKEPRTKPAVYGLTTLGLAGLALALGNSAMADTRAVYSADAGEVVIEVRDRDNIRYRMPDGGFLLITDGEAHALNRDDSGWFAVSGEQVAELARQAGAATDVRLSRRDDSHTIAGVEGETYAVEEGDSWADEWQPTGEVILSEDPRLRDLGPAFSRLAKMFGGVDEVPELTGNIGSESSLAPLRSAGLELQSFSNASLPDSSFSLPPNVRHLEMSAALEDDTGEPREPGWLTREMMGASEDVRDDATRETRREVRRSIREGVQSLF